MNIDTNFFSPTDYEKYPPCGMFTIPHLIVLLFCILGIVIAVIYTKKISKNKLKNLTKVFGIVLVILEIFKTIYNIYYDYTNIDSIVPLHFCSLFIYSCLMAGFGKGQIEKFGSSFIVGAGIVCGGAFLIFPTTSLLSHPLFHFLSIHSMFYHSLMVYLGIMYIIKDVFEPTLLNFKYYLLYSFVFYIPALVINFTFNSNLMFLRAPYRIPIQLLSKIQEYSQIMYTIIIMIAYLLSYVLPYIIYIIKKHKLIRK